MEGQLGQLSSCLLPVVGWTPGGALGTCTSSQEPAGQDRVTSDQDLGGEGAQGTG